LDWQNDYVLNIRYRNYRIAKALGRAYRDTGQLAVVQIAWQLHDDYGELIPEHQDYLK
jgi:hypothetical protein